MRGIRDGQLFCRFDRQSKVDSECRDKRTWALFSPTGNGGFHWQLQVELFRSECRDNGPSFLSVLAEPEGFARNGSLPATGWGVNDSPKTPQYSATSSINILQCHSMRESAGQAALHPPPRHRVSNPGNAVVIPQSVKQTSPYGS